MRTKLFTVVLMVVALLMLLAVTCPEDGSGAYFTGKTRTSESGRLMKEYRCMAYSHLFWTSD